MSNVSRKIRRGRAFRQRILDPLATQDRGHMRSRTWALGGGGAGSGGSSSGGAANGGGAGTMTPPGGGNYVGSDSPDFGPNVLIFDPSMGTSAIQAKLDDVFNRQQTSQFGSGRYAYFFK